jgi:RNA-binding motif X-linked protein 2
VHLNRDKETGKSKGFAFLRYEDQRSTDLAVDNLGGATIMGRIIRVDHTRYKKKDDEEVPQLEESSLNHTAGAIEEDEAANEQSKPAIERPPLPEELELAALIRDHDDDDPMKAFLIQEKKDQIAAALAKLDSSRDSKSGHKSRRSHREEHRHHHRHRSHRSRERDGDRDRRRHRSRERDDSRDRRRNRSREADDDGARRRHRSSGSDDGRDGRRHGSRDPDDDRDRRRPRSRDSDENRDRRGHRRERSPDRRRRRS